MPIILMRRAITLFLSFILILSISGISAVKADTQTLLVIRVKPDGMTTVPCGATWAEACDLQVLLSTPPVPSPNPFEIHAMGGTYYPFPKVDPTSVDYPTYSRMISFHLSSGMILYGGYAGLDAQAGEDPDSRDLIRHESILSGDIDQDNDPNDVSGSVHTFHVVDAKNSDSSVLLDGFTITDGSATDPTNYYPYQWGGGIVADGSSATFSHLIIKNNAGRYGGGMLLGKTSEYAVDSQAVLNDVQFIHNTAESGGGLYLFNGSAQLSYVTFDGNVTRMGGGGLMAATFDPGISTLDTSTTRINLVIDHTIFEHNLNPTGLGGGIFIASDYGTPRAVLRGSDITFHENSALRGGGIHDLSADISLNRVLFDQNTAQEAGGGMSNTLNSVVKLTNATFNGNRALSGEGGGIYNLDTPDAVFRFITMTNNQAAGTGGAIFQSLLNPIGNDSTYTSSLLLENSILWANGTMPIDMSMEGSGEVHLVPNHNIIGGINIGQTNLNVDPHLAALGSYGGSTQTFPLLPGSPAVDQIAPAQCLDAEGHPLTDDQRGIPRPQGERCDLGAFEARPFSLSVLSGSNQSAARGTDFALPLVVQISASDPALVDGGMVTFSVVGENASAGETAAATLSSPAAMITNGRASVTVKANHQAGSYKVVASIPSADPVEFNLKNLGYNLYLPLLTLSKP